MNKNAKDQRPAVWIGHVALHSDAVAASCEFMQQVGMRLITADENFALLELRGGTHLVITDDANSELLRGRFDLMVDNLDDTHRQLLELGLAPGEIERGRIHDSFEIHEPGGTKILFNSSHVGDMPV